MDVIIFISKKLGLPDAPFNDPTRPWQSATTLYSLGVKTKRVSAENRCGYGGVLYVQVGEMLGARDGNDGMKCGTEKGKFEHDLAF